MTPFILINNRNLLLNEIDKFQPLSPFENSTVSFIQDWLAGQQEFSIQTSGSTGKPKTISITRAQMELSARLTINALQLLPGQTALVCLDTMYIAGKMMLVRALINQMNIIALEPDANPLLNMDLQPDFIALVPLQLQEIIKSEASKQIFNAMKAVIIGGAPVNNLLEAQIQVIEAPIYATYGMTETVSHFALKKLNGPDKSDFFQTFADVRLNLDDRGCLTVKSALTANKELITNDRVKIHSANQFQWLGRIDNTINTGGVKVQSEKVEKVVELVFDDLKISNRFFVAGIPDDKLGEKIMLVVEAPIKPIEESEVLKALANLLDKYEVPKGVIYVHTFKETKTGKVNRRANISV